jgi:hypothetical protein
VRAFELVRQEYEHAEGRNRVLFTVGTVFYDDGVPYVLDTDLVDGKFSRVGATLDIGNG